MMNKAEQFKTIIKFISSTVLLAMQTLLYGYTWMTYYGSNIWDAPFYRRGNWLVIALYGLLLFLFINTYGGFKIGYLRKLDAIFSQILATLCVNVITYIQICLLDRHFVDVIPFLGFTFIEGIIIAVWANIYQLIYAWLFPPRRMILIYGERPVFGLKDKINSRGDKYNICEMVDINKGLEYVYNKMIGYEAVIIGDIPSQYRNQILKRCFEKSIRTYMLTKISDVILRGSDDIHLFDSPLLLARNSGLSFEQKVIKRLTDVLVSSIMLVIASPVMLVVAFLIRIYDGGTALYKQVRLTQDGREFEVYKFRSMIMEAEKDGVARLSMSGDSRITPIGKFIRATRLDELPQLINIIKGDMSLVGPRPERPEIAAEYSEYMPEFGYRLKVKAGLTGYAQIYGKYNTLPYDKLKLDLMYIQNYSFRLDLKLILMTFKIMFMKDSTEGVADGQLTAATMEAGFGVERKAGTVISDEKKIR